MVHVLIQKLACYPSTTTANKVSKVNKTQTGKERKESSSKQAKTTKPKKQQKQGLRKRGWPKKRSQPASDSNNDEERSCIYCLKPWANSIPGQELVRCCVRMGSFGLLWEITIFCVSELWILEWLMVFSVSIQVMITCNLAVVNYLLGKRGYVFGSVGLSVFLSVSLFVCLLFVDNITQKVMNGLGWNFMEGSWVVQWWTD